MRHRIFPLGRAAAFGLLLGSLTVVESGSALAASDASKIGARAVPMLTRLLVYISSDPHVNYGSLTVNGDDILISKLTILDRQREIGSADTVVIESPAERPQGGFSAKQITLQGVKLPSGPRADGTELSLGGDTISIADAIVPDLAEIESTKKLTAFSSIVLTGLHIPAILPGDQDISIGSVGVDVADIQDGRPNSARLKITGVPANFMLRPAVASVGWADSAKIAEVLAQLGYPDARMDAAISASYDGDRQMLMIDEIEIEGPDMGKLSVQLRLSGVQRDNLMDVGGIPELSSTAMLESARIRFDDTGVTNRVLDMIVRQSAAKRSDLVKTISAQIRLGLANSPISGTPLQTQVEEAATSFLTEPKSVVAYLDPIRPVNLGSFWEAIRKDPSLAAQSLGVSVAATNE